MGELSSPGGSTPDLSCSLTRRLSTWPQLLDPRNMSEPARCRNGIVSKPRFPILLTWRPPPARGPPTHRPASSCSLCRGLNCVSHSRVEALPPKVIVFGGGLWEACAHGHFCEAHVSCYGGRRSACLSACTALTFTGCDGTSGGKVAQPWPGLWVGVSRRPSRPCHVIPSSQRQVQSFRTSKSPAWLFLCQTKVTLGSLL